MNYGKHGIAAKQQALNSNTNKLGHMLLVGAVKYIIIALIGLCICGAFAGLGLFRSILAVTPQIRLVDVVASGQATVVYDKDGNEIDQYVSSNSNRLRIESMDELPDYLGYAFVAIEDERFYQHYGIDYKGMVRAGYQYVITRGSSAQGASTLTQQLLKNTVFTTWTEEGKNKIKKIKRKLQEQYLALELSKYFTKEQVLLEYMNAINLGQNTLGVEAAAKRYFGKSASKLTISEAAVIACITQNPSGYNPIRFPEKNASRREKCLNKMLELEFITKAEYDEAIADTDAVYERIGLYDVDYRVSTTATSGSYFSDALYEQVLSDLKAAGYKAATAEKMLTSGGLKIESTMDSRIQAIANEEFANPANFPEQVNWYLTYALTITDLAGDQHHFSKENMTTWFKQNVNKNFTLIFASQEAAHEAIDTYRASRIDALGLPADHTKYKESISLTAQPQCAMAIEDQSTGYVLALVGGRGTKEGRRTLNRATVAKRSPGSTFKVLAAFAPALDAGGETLATVYNDAPFNYYTGTPVRNWYKTGYRGISSIREAIRESMNIIAVKTETVIGPRLGYDYLLDFGFSTLTDGTVINGKTYTDINQTLALGGLTNGVTPYELNAAYASIANNGLYVEPKLYTRVLDSDGNVILDNTKQKTRQVLRETTSYLLIDAMRDVIETGTATRCKFDNMDIAGKTGSTSEYKDVWFAGFSPYYTCSIWTGYDNNHSMISEGTGRETNISKDLWKAIMSRVHEGLPYAEFEMPEGIIETEICSQSGLLPIPGICDEHTVTELFEEGTEPYEYCNVHYFGDICMYDGLPACPNCPFKIQGTLVLPLPEDPILYEGSTIITEDEFGNQTVTPPDTRRNCRHDDAFFASPDYMSIISGQQWELWWRANNPQ